MSNNPKKLTLSELPLEVDKDTSFTETNPILMVVMVVGFAMVVIGGFNILFGPDSLYISRSGPTFGEFLQLFPGPIASVGVFLVAMPNMIKDARAKKFIKDLKASYVLDTDGLEPGTELTFEVASNNKVIISSNAETLAESVSADQ